MIFGTGVIAESQIKERDKRRPITRGDISVIVEIILRFKYANRHYVERVVRTAECVECKYIV